MNIQRLQYAYISETEGCSICEELKPTNHKLKCSNNKYFCVGCMASYLEFLVEKGDTTGRVDCPCKCGYNFWYIIYPFGSTRMNRHFDILRNRYNSYLLTLSSERIELTEDTIDKYINEEILNTKCPRCRQVYYQFDGCCALRCNRCGTFFCAYCDRISYTNQSNHIHVARCSYNLYNQGVVWPRQYRKSIRIPLIAKQIEEMMVRFPKKKFEIYENYKEYHKYIPKPHTCFENNLSIIVGLICAVAWFIILMVAPMIPIVCVYLLYNNYIGYGNSMDIFLNITYWAITIGFMLAAIAVYKKIERDGDRW